MQMPGFLSYLLVELCSRLINSLHLGLRLPHKLGDVKSFYFIASGPFYIGNILPGRNTVRPTLVYSTGPFICSQFEI